MSEKSMKAEAPSDRELRVMTALADQHRARAEHYAALATQQAGQGEAVAINYVILHDFAQRKRVGYNELCVAVNDAIKSMATPPAPQQPEALAQQERDREGGK